MTSTNLQKEIVESGRVSAPLHLFLCTDRKCGGISHNLQQYVEFCTFRVSGALAVPLAGDGLLSPVLSTHITVTFAKPCVF